MKALVYEGPGKKSLKEVENPNIINDGDAIVKLVKTTICGTDLHILSGDVAAVKEGTILGHEGVGIVEEVGPGVKNFKPGDKVIISCVTSCGSCHYCKQALYAHCEDGGWILGHLINGTQAEYVHIPHADNSLYHIPKGISDDAAVMISDILPTGLEIGVLNGQVKPGDTVTIVGAGPIGMAVLLTAQFYSPSKIIMVDLDDNRLEEAKKFGATHTVNSKDTESAIKQIMELTDGRGVDVAVEAAGFPVTFDICQKVLAPGGNLANVGVHGKSVDLELQDLWIRNVTITTGLVSTNSTPMLLKTLASGKIKVEELITHNFKFENMLDAYETFQNASKEKAMKVIIDFE
ncbi:zinc-dependent alcohol dehydrogenase family protein [Ureibacillus thermosphaericus]|uniref:zinc-dependent alcohol dehydrogenase family protein n=1 Tax=Ureibacillus thermosphaericus TaxID=51173 RepID=UPI000BBCDFBD|nr:zinc-dependent alcohol dehydrogenase family protein [Ureibacillus thermosphaericus]